MTRLQDQIQRARWVGLVAGLALSFGVLGCADSADEPLDKEPIEPATKQTQEVALSHKNNSGFDFVRLEKQPESDRARGVVDGCQEGSAEACYELGDMLHGGDDIVRDNDLSVAIIDHACREGFIRACYDMGVRFHLGVELEQDLHASRAYFQHGCAQANATSCHMLARIARDGLGVPVDLELADRYADRSCALGYAPDCETSWPTRHNVGDHEAALSAAASDEVVDYARACDSGLMNACAQLAGAYEHGKGIAQDTEQAYVLYESACDWGQLDACEVYRAMGQ
jgi:TPR repeat protein